MSWRDWMASIAQPEQVDVMLRGTQERLKLARQGRDATGSPLVLTEDGLKVLILQLEWAMTYWTARKMGVPANELDHLFSTEPHYPVRLW